MLVLLISSVCVVPCSLSVLRTRVLVLKITGYGSGAGLAMAGDKSPLSRLLILLSISAVLLYFMKKK